MPRLSITFEPFRRDMYSREELFEGFDFNDPRSFAATRDFAIYHEYIVSGKYAPRDFFTAMMQALHDNAVTQALRDFLDTSKARPIGVMGGHKLARGSVPYRMVVQLAGELTRRGFTMLSGGGPGAMEATHLGALLAQANDDQLQAAIASLAERPTVPDLTNLIGADGKPNDGQVKAAHAWFAPAHEIAVSVRNPGASLAVPTWLYGHEPTSPLATHIAKYFQNSIREDGLLAVATNGIVYVEGRAGTLQEIFQDAAQNYYRTFGGFSPMVFLGSAYWSARIPAVPVLEALFGPKDFAEYVLLTDDVGQAADFLQSHGTTEDAAERIDRYLSHEAHGREA
jgi:predicted Rossmann-fold nucleotide-binding protein